MSQLVHRFFMLFPDFQSSATTLMNLLGPVCMVEKRHIERHIKHRQCLITLWNQHNMFPATLHAVRGDHW